MKRTLLIAAFYKYSPFFLKNSTYSLEYFFPVGRATVQTPGRVASRATTGGTTGLWVSVGSSLRREAVDFQQGQVQLAYLQEYPIEGCLILEGACQEGGILLLRHLQSLEPC